MTGVTSRLKTETPLATLPADEAPARLALSAQPLLVLSEDEELIALLAAVTNPVHEVRAAGSESDFSEDLLRCHAGVAVLDCAALTTPAGELARRLRAQFPELVLIVAGRVADQEQLAGEITVGTVHRFLHKPLSEQRVRLFVDAAWRRHGEVRSAPRGNFAPTGRARRAAACLAAVIVLGLAAGAFVWNATRTPGSGAEHAAAAVPGGHIAAGDAELERLLARAQRALNAGELTTPPGASAADLYREAL
ncbi:MAG: hypothetical protein JO361_04530, partial [Gammaproteobacteria bacterium]|nr:hypothetical protein [Gammaproteobacteria bacterium]